MIREKEETRHEGIISDVFRGLVSQTLFSGEWRVTCQALNRISRGLLKSFCSCWGRQQVDLPGPLGFLTIHLKLFKICLHRSSFKLCVHFSVLPPISILTLTSAIFENLHFFLIFWSKKCPQGRIWRSDTISCCCYSVINYDKLSNAH